MKPQKIDAVAKEWIDLKSELAKIEKRQKELKEPLETFLKEQPEQTAELNGWKFTRLEVERESFKLSEAKEKIDGRTLKPFISTSNFSQIRTVWKGGDKFE